MGETTALRPEDALAKINAALFPPPRKERGEVMVCADAYYELEGAIIDLKRLKADAVCIKTVERVQQQILAVSKVLQKAGVR